MPNKFIDYSLTLKDTNVLKGIAICAMLWHHLFLGHSEYGTITQTIAQTCNICVSIFLFVSGYGLTIQFSKINTNSFKNKFIDTIKFLCKRYTKFYLNYWIIFCITVPLGIFLFNRPFETVYGIDAEMPGFAVLDFLGLMGKQSYNITWWFNRLILYFYFFFPLLYLGMRYIISGLAILILLYVWPSQILYHFEELDIAFPLYFYIFALGIFCARHKGSLNKLLNKLNSKAIFGLTFGGLIATLFVWKTELHPSTQITTWDCLATLFLSYFVISIRQLIHKDFKLLTFLGKHSMNMYLTHTFIFAYFFKDFIYWFSNPVLIFLVLLGCSLLLSMVVEFIKEKAQFYKLQDKIISQISNLHLTK